MLNVEQQKSSNHREKCQKVRVLVGLQFVRRRYTVRKHDDSISQALREMNIDQQLTTVRSQSKRYVVV